MEASYCQCVSSAKGSSRNRPWFDIVKVAHLFDSFVRFKAGNGQRISFWFDRWLSDLTLKFAFPLMYNVSLKKRCQLWIARIVSMRFGTWLSKEDFFIVSNRLGFSW